METRLSRFCDALIEAGWLAALVVAPLFFNVYSSRTFEPDKISLVRSIALVMLGAWLVKTVDVGWPGAAGPSFGARLRGFARTPLILPTLLLALAYLVSTALSVSPRISLLGSYQRMQGTFSMFSYIIIFLLVVTHLRRREQLDRILFTIILTSLPIALYGILQRYGLDPLPWGGDVQSRIAANMGNAIFIAAYFIMAFFLTFDRLVRSFGRLLTSDEGTVGEAVVAGGYLFILVVQSVAIVFSQSRGPWLGWAGGLYIFILLGLVSLRQRSPLAARGRDALLAVVLAGAWLVLGLLGLAVGGPNGFLAGAAVGALATGIAYIGLVVGRRGWPWLWLSWLVLAVVGAGFLLVFNLPGSPLEPLRSLPYVGRLGQLLETDDGTGKVRVLIWQGVTEMIVPHDPLIYPGGQPDPLNAFRPLVGYGPETMWVAYNPFYPPDLAHLEARNASPDRSHNETFDSLVITGYLGFAAYTFLFASIFYYALRWLGLMATQGERNLYIVLALAGGVAGAVVPLALEGTLRFIGVGIPFGFILGFIVYVTIAAVRARREHALEMDPARLLFVVALLATIVAHYIEIHFGIAIVSTRTYFWTLAGVLVAVGTGRLALAPVAEAAAAPAAEAVGERSRARARRRTPAPAPRRRALAGWAQGDAVSIWPYACIAGLVMLTLAWNFVVNQTQETRTLTIFWNALTTRLVAATRVPVPSLGTLWMVLFTWLVGMLIAVAGYGRRDARQGWGRMAAVYSLVTWGGFLVFGLWQAASIRAQVITSVQGIEAAALHVAGHIVRYYVVLLLAGLALAAAIWAGRWPQALPLARQRWLTAGSALAVAVVLALLINSFNIAVVRADTVYKQGQVYEDSQQWQVSALLYKRAIAIVPHEDFYHLFLGRVLLEQARQAEEKPRQVADGLTAREALALPVSYLATLGREDMLAVAQAVLQHTRDLNPLNTDHSANLARLYRAWADLTSDPATKMAHFQQSLAHYAEATTLSPNAAHLQNEIAVVYLQMGQAELLDADEAYGQADAYLQRSLALDREFEQTYLYLSELHLSRNDLAAAAEALNQALALNPDSVIARSTLAQIRQREGDLAGAIAQTQEVLRINPNDASAYYNLAILYRQQGNLAEALAAARQARQFFAEARRADADALIAAIEQQMASGN